MSHELRTPMNAIIGFSQLLQQGFYGELNAKQNEYLGDILKSAEHLHGLINEILDLSQIEAGKMQLNPSTVAVKDVLEECIGLISHKAGLHGVAIQKPEYDGETAYVDAMRFKQVIINILSNAVKYNHSGGSVRICLERPISDNRLTIAISDTGVGISPEKLSWIFEPFTRAVTRPEEIEGTGLGLALSKRMIEEMNGSIECESRLGEGSCFRIDVPISNAHP